MHPSAALRRRTCSARRAANISPLRIGVFADRRLRPCADAPHQLLADDIAIHARYPVIWCEQSGPTYAGSLVLGPTALVLDGVAAGDRAVVDVPYADLARVHMASGGSERVGGRPTLLVETGERLFRIAAVAGAGVMGEVADALTRAMTVA